MQFERTPARAFFFIRRTGFEHLSTNNVRQIVNKMEVIFSCICLDNFYKCLYLKA